MAHTIPLEALDKDGSFNVHGQTNQRQTPNHPVANQLRGKLAKRQKPDTNEMLFF